MALERGWSVNLGGGFHHGSSLGSGSGTGFCPYADISLAVEYLHKYYNSEMKIMIIDLDATQVTPFITH